MGMIAPPGYTFVADRSIGSAAHLVGIGPWPGLGQTVVGLCGLSVVAEDVFQDTSETLNSVNPYTLSSRQMPPTPCPSCWAIAKQQMNPRQPSQQTSSRRSPCCGATMVADPITLDAICGQCGRVISVDDILNAAGVPLRDVKGGRKVPLRGNTYPVKEELKALGARWDMDQRVWMVPESRYDDALRIVARGPQPASTYSSPSFQAPPPPSGDPSYFNPTYGSNPYGANPYTSYVPPYTPPDPDPFKFGATTTSKPPRARVRRRFPPENFEEISTPYVVEGPRCWECGKPMEESAVEARHGSWLEFWCGCQD